MIDHLLLHPLVTSGPDADNLGNLQNTILGAITDTNYDVVAFGGSIGLETKLAELVLAGRKRATANLLRNFVGEEKLPVIGGSVVTVDGDGKPRCIWRITELRIGRIDSVDDAFAWDEGEGDRTRDWWLDAHRRLYAAHGDVKTVFERFTMVWPPEAADSAERGKV
jgi:uncharacterized protein YhfF